MADETKVVGSADGGAQTEQPGDTVDLAKVRQEAINIGYGKAMAKAEKEWAGREERVRQSLLTELGLTDAAAIEAHKAALVDADKRRPEWERKALQLERALTETAKKVEEAEKARQEWGERWFGEFRGRVAANVARAVNLHPEAEDDLENYLSRSFVTTKEEPDRMVFKDRGAEIDLAEPTAMQKIAEHVQKHKPIWIKPSVAGHGSGTSMVRPQNGQSKLTPAESRDLFIKEAIGNMSIVRR